MGGLVPDHSLKRWCRNRHVLPATPDVLDMDCAGPLQSAWEVREVHHLEVHPDRIKRATEKFTRVHTTLQAWSLEEFYKVVLLDSDIRVCRDIDDLVVMPTHAAVMWGHIDSRPGVRNSTSYYVKGTFTSKGGIN